LITKLGLGAAWLALFTWNAFAQTPASPPKMECYVIGVLESTPARADANYKAGIHLETLGLSWDRFEPRPGQINVSYVGKVKAQIAAYRAAHQLVQLDFGFQYPPQWVKDIPGARFVNQYGKAYINQSPGMDVVDEIFNETVREREAAYVAKVFELLGTDFFAVRLGWGYFGELGYPAAVYNGTRNCYWEFGAIAQGKTPGLPEGIPACPRPGWVPGTPGEAHLAAKEFAEWYLAALANCEAWEIKTVRHYYQGKLPVLYGSWGMRTGIEEREIAADLGDESQTEIQMGYDYDRLIAAIDDPNVIPYTTWIDANPSNCDDNSPDVQRWSPAHYIADRASRIHQPALRVWGENAGHANRATLELSMHRMRQYGMLGLVWAFEGELYDGSRKYASISDMVQLIGTLPKNKQRGN